MVTKQSPKYKLNKIDLTKILKGSGIAVAAALLTYATDIIPNIDWGVAAPIVVAASGILINIGRKWLSK